MPEGNGIHDPEYNRTQVFKETTAGWQRFVPELVTWRGPGNHMTILKPPHIEDWLRQ